MSRLIIEILSNEMIMIHEFILILSMIYFQENLAIFRGFVIKKLPRIPRRGIKMCSKIFFTRKKAILRFLSLVLAIMCLSGCGFFHHEDAEKVQTVHRKGADAVLKTAYSQIGAKYKAGSASPKSGFDCSGFVYWVYKKNGYSVPRMSTAQAKCGQSVSKKSVKRGDILVFKVNQSPHGYHTGIYVGKNKFIHSPSKGKAVKVDPINNVYWKDKLVAVRRVVS